MMSFRAVGGDRVAISEAVDGIGRRVQAISLARRIASWIC